MVRSCRFVIALWMIVSAVAFLPTAGASGSVGCIGLRPPVPGDVVADYAPTGRYSGHWGVDFDAPTGTIVRAASSGTVAFSGTVAGNRTITIDHGGGLKTSYSYLAERWLGAGHRVEPGQALGTVGLAHGLGGLHFSVRIAGAYVNPTPLLSCRPLALSKGLRLVPDTP